jgi:hypothetical protein
MIGAMVANLDGVVPMSCANDPPPPLACVPGAIPMTQRLQHFALARTLLNQQATERTDLVDGYAFRFDADQLLELARFIDNERKCCPFMTFELVVAPEAGPVWLRMTGPDGTRALLQAELSITGPCGCGT